MLGEIYVLQRFISYTLSTIPNFQILTVWLLTTMVLQKISHAYVVLIVNVGTHLCSATIHQFVTKRSRQFQNPTNKRYEGTDFLDLHLFWHVTENAMKSIILEMKHSGEPFYDNQPFSQAGWKEKSYFFPVSEIRFSERSQ